MGNPASRFRRAIQKGDEVVACQLYVQYPEIRGQFDPCSPYGESEDQNTPLHFVAKFCMKSLLKDFLKRGANPNLLNKLEQTALHLLMICSKSPVNDQRRLDCLHILMKWRGKQLGNNAQEQLNLCAVDKENRSALHFAAASGLFLCVEYLITKGAPLFLEDCYNLTACDLAHRNHHFSISAFVEAKMVFHSSLQRDKSQVDSVQSSLNSPDDNYAGLCNLDLQDAKDQLIVVTSDMLQVPLFTAEALLCYHNWCREDLIDSWMQSPSAVCEKAGVPLSEESYNFVVLRNRDRANCAENAGKNLHLEAHCNICDEPIDIVDQNIKLPCDHLFCHHCWRSYLSTKICEGKTQNLLCPGCNCKQVVPVEMTDRLVSRDMAQRYLQLDIQAFVDTNPDLRWCPYPSCDRAIQIVPRRTSEIYSANGSDSMTVDCGKGHFCCWQCLGDAHEPCSCEIWRNWNSKIKQINPSEVDDQLAERQRIATAYWLVKNSKKCPNCQNHIEKNEGCNHMTCLMCKHEFCWLCLKPWKTHSSQTGGYFRCNLVAAARKADDEHQREQQTVAEKHVQVENVSQFLQFYRQFRRQEDKFKLEVRVLHAIDKKMDSLQSIAHVMGAENVETQFIDDAVKELLKSRQIVKGSYPYSYFLGNSEDKRAVFEFMQYELERQTDLLSSMVAQPFLKTPRYHIIDATRELMRKRCEFLDAVHRGLIPEDKDFHKILGKVDDIRHVHSWQIGRNRQPSHVPRFGIYGNAYYSMSTDTSNADKSCPTDKRDEEAEKTCCANNAGWSPRTLVVAQFDYNGYSTEELSIRAGDVIEVTERRNDGWWRGRCNGHQGLFPSTFATDLESIEAGTLLHHSNLDFVITRDKEKNR